MFSSRSACVLKHLDRERSLLCNSMDDLDPPRTEAASILRFFDNHDAEQIILDRQRHRHQQAARIHEIRFALKLRVDAQP